MKSTILVLTMVILFPILAMVGVDDDLSNNLSKSKCVHSWYEHCGEASGS